MAKIVEYKIATNNNYKEYGWNDQTEAQVLFDGIEFGDWLYNQGIEFDESNGCFEIIEDGEKTGEAYLIVSERELADRHIFDGNGNEVELSALNSNDERRVDNTIDYMSEERKSAAIAVFDRLFVVDKTYGDAVPLAEDLGFPDAVIAAIKALEE